MNCNPCSKEITNQRKPRLLPIFSSTKDKHLQTVNVFIKDECTLPNCLGYRSSRVYGHETSSKNEKVRVEKHIFSLVLDFQSLYFLFHTSNYWRLQARDWGNPISIISLVSLANAMYGFSSFCPLKGQRFYHSFITYSCIHYFT